MERKRILIVVKTYPNLSLKYDELVCTAGVLEDGSWMRLYPIQFRRMDYGRQYKKYEWVEFDVHKRTEDMRPESYTPDIGTMQVRDYIDTGSNWKQRKEHVLKTVYRDMTELIELAHNNKLSIAVFKPERVMRFTYQKVSSEEHQKYDKKMKDILEKRRQLSLLDDGLSDVAIVSKPGYRFYYEFTDVNSKSSKMMIEDWEIQALHRNCLAKGKSKEGAARDVRKRYWDDFVLTKDIHLILGTTLEFHRRKAKNPFTIIGTFTPKKESGSQPNGTPRLDI